MMPTIVMSVRKYWPAFWIMKPRPDGAAISSAATSARKPVDTPVRMPAMK